MTNRELAEKVKAATGVSGGIIFDITKPDGTPAQAVGRIAPARAWLEKADQPRNTINTSIRRVSRYQCPGMICGAAGSDAFIVLQGVRREAVRKYENYRKGNGMNAVKDDSCA